MTPPRLLVADDHDMLREALVDLLRQAGFDIVGQAADGADAVALSKQLEPDVVLMDLRMPVLSGLDVARLIKHDSPATEVVLLTAFESPALQQQAEEYRRALQALHRDDLGAYQRAVERLGQLIQQAQRLTRAPPPPRPPRRPARPDQ